MGSCAVVLNTEGRGSSGTMEPEKLNGRYGRPRPRQVLTLPKYLVRFNHRFSGYGFSGGTKVSAAPKATVAEILASILAVESISADDDFFKLGGDSLAATVLMAAIEHIHGVVIDPVEIFERPRIGEFSDWLEGMLAQPVGQLAEQG